MHPLVSHINNKDSFTLVELLVVIGILAILTAAVLIIINPAEYLKSSRDATRMSDLSSINKALSVLETQGITSFGTANRVYISIADDASSTCGSLGLPTLPTNWLYQCVSTSNLQKTDGTGWIPVNFSSAPSLSFSNLPIDPVNSTSSYYSYYTGGSFELNAILESSKYRLSGDKDRTSTDGGDSFAVYEVGSSKSLSPFKDTGLVGYWTFEEGSGGTVYDKSSYGFNGTWYGTGSHYGTGKVGSYSGKFNTPTVTSDYVLIPSQLASTTHGIAEASLLMWIKLDNEIPANPYNGLIQLTGYANSNGGFYPYTTGLIYSDTFKTDRVQAISYTGYSLTGWHLLAITTTYGTNGWKMYMNGNVIKQVTGEATVATNYQNVTIGLNSSSRRTQGYIDDVRIYNYALSASEIKAIYNATR